MPQFARRLWFVMVMFPAVAVFAQSPRPLIDADKPMGGWKFYDAPEFPGAKGTLALDEPFEGRPVLKLAGDFSAGGQYVQASIVPPNVPVDTITFWLNAPAGMNTLGTRLVDGSGQTHQIKLKIADHGGWQQVVIPVRAYFDKLGTSSALNIAEQYEHWGGANDAKWHQPCRLLAILDTRHAPGVTGSLLVRDAMLTPAPETSIVTRSLPFDTALAAGVVDWKLNLGWEFAGARGDLKLLAAEPPAEHHALHLEADFTQGGRYVSAERSLEDFNVKAIEAIHLKMRSPNARTYTLRLNDGTGQCFQFKGRTVEADGQWHDLTIDPRKVGGVEHWGGANDGQWHDPARGIAILLTRESSEDLKPWMDLAPDALDATIEAQRQGDTIRETFDDAAALEGGWTLEGHVALSEPGAAGGRCIELARTIDEIEKPASATGPRFAVAPGIWAIALTQRSDLHSPDNSYHAAVMLEVFDHAGASMTKLPVAYGMGKTAWQKVTKTLDLPDGAAAGRFVVTFEKTYGSYQLDDLSAARLSTQPVHQKVRRILLSSDVLGNLFMPGDEVRLHLRVEADAPLMPEECKATCTLRDDGGALMLEPIDVTLTSGESKPGQFTYAADVTLPADRIMIGKFYELHVAVPQAQAEPTEEYAGLAILPPAPTNRYAPTQVPFTVRNWDSRIPVYFELADRLGIRQVGVWGGWSSKPPYKPEGPGIDLCRKLGMKWITGTRASEVEDHGFANIDETALRQGMRNFLEKYADQGLSMIALGNEPHGTGQKVLDNVEAYKAIYETVKAFDPNIIVLGTSVEPNEEYFKAGYQNALDAYDFHSYESYDEMRQTMRQYRDLMKKYDAVKPLHATEIGLNSQGQTRRAVATTMIKKITTFFAEGGATIGWFTIQYPDPKGQARGSITDTHCMIDCKYDLYNPRLDAVTYYHLVNAIGVKKFVDQKVYDNGVRAYLFRDEAGHCLEVMWADDATKIVDVPIHAAGAIDCVRLDGSRSALHAVHDAITLSVSDAPLMLLFDGAEAKLAESLAPPKVSLTAPAAVKRGDALSVDLTVDGLTAGDLSVCGPVMWKAELADAGAGHVTLTIHAPVATPGRVARFEVQRRDGTGVNASVCIQVDVQ
ncbi:MAG: cellulase family glycosylhydrolase [Planctomycetes bacterium]|nr:cellulase family glycosylhydrolase [Planctomycetota bacterium]